MSLNMNEIREAIKTVPVEFCNVKVSTLGGVDRASLLIAVSIDPKESWEYEIFENSRYCRVSLNHEMKFQVFSSSVKFKFRKRTTPTTEKVIEAFQELIAEMRIQMGK